MNITVVVPAFNNPASVERCLASIDRQTLTAPRRLASIVVVDDGSEFAIENAVGRREDVVPTMIIRHAENSGRAAARNAGARSTDVDCLVFLDADLELMTTKALDVLVQALVNGSRVAVGRIESSRSGFWGWYDARFVRKIAEEQDAGMAWMSTTAFCGLHRDRFESVGGFDSGFVGYGFEDRDLLLRLIQSGCEIIHVKEATASHQGEASAFRIGRKLHESGRLTAPRFREKHPEAYGRMAYKSIDVSSSSGLVRQATRLSFAITDLVAAGLLRIGDHHFVPFTLRAWLCRMHFALAFGAGTAEEVVRRT